LITVFCIFLSQKISFCPTMCLTKAGCFCHWGAQLGPASSRPRRTTRIPIPQNDSEADKTPLDVLPTVFRPSTPPPQTLVSSTLPLQPSNIPKTPTRPTPLTGKRKRQSKVAQKAVKTSRRSLTRVASVGPPDGSPTKRANAILQPRDLIVPHVSALLAGPVRPPTTHREDIWRFMRPVNNDAKASYQECQMPLFALVPQTKRPKSDWVGCVLCE
jgi:hypothetical protein